MATLPLSSIFIGKGDVVSPQVTGPFTSRGGASVQPHTTGAPYGQGMVLGHGKIPLVLDFGDFLSINQLHKNLHNQPFFTHVLPLQEQYIHEKYDNKYLEDYRPTTFTIKAGHSNAVLG